MSVRIWDGVRTGDKCDVRDVGAWNEGRWDGEDGILNE